MNMTKPGRAYLRNYRTGKGLPVLQIILTHMPRFIPETYRPFWELNLARFRPIQTPAKNLLLW